MEKDRKGYVREQAEDSKFDLRVISDPETNALTYALTPATTSSTEDGEFRPTNYMEKVSRYVEKHDGRSKTEVSTAVGGKKSAVVAAIDVLEDEGYIEFEKKGNSTLLRHVRPFREDSLEELLGIVTPDPRPVTPMNVPEDF